MIKAVLFDFDGTIVDSLKHHLSAYRHVFSSFGKDLSDEEIIRDAFYTPRDHKTGLYGITDPQKFEDLYMAYMDKAVEHFTLHDHLIQALDFLKRKDIKCAIITFAHSDLIRRHIQYLDITVYFDAVLGDNDVTKPKPDPEIARKALNALKVLPNEALLVGDTDLDIHTGKNAGIKTALFVPDTNLPFIDLEKYRKTNPDFEFSDFSTLPKIVKQLERKAP